VVSFAQIVACYPIRRPMQSCPQCHSEVDSGLQFCPVDGADLSGAPDPLIGTVLGERYELERRIGEGGMGKVYLGRDRETGDPVAVKLLHSEMLNLGQAVKRFRREGAAAGKLDHPHVVKMRDSGQTADGALFLVMEYVEGRALGDVLHEEGPLPPARVIRIARQVLEALDAAHGEGVVHRDLKPDNIMLCEVGSDHDFAKILDFGIAKILNEETPDALTRTGMVFGTPEYMSPEQGVGQKIDHRADLYAAGVVFYEMLCGRRPFEGDDKIAVIAQHISVVPPPPSQRVEGRTISIPPALEGAIMTAMQKKPGERFQTASDFLHAVELAERSLASWTPPARTQLETLSDTLPASALPPGTALSATAGRRAARRPRSIAPTTLEPALRSARLWLRSTWARVPAGRRPWVFGGLGATVMLALVIAIGSGGGEKARPPDDDPAATGADRPDPVATKGTAGTPAAKPRPAAPPDAARPGLDLPFGALRAELSWNPLEWVEPATPAETAARDALRADQPDAALDALAATPPGTPAGHYLRGRALAMKADWAGAKTELVQAFALAPGLRRDRALIERAIGVACGPTPSAAPARAVLEAIGKEAASLEVKGMLEADDATERLAATAAKLKAEKKKLDPADAKLLSDARKKRKTLRKLVEKADPSYDLSRIWVSELRDTKDCDGRAALIRSIRAARVADALPVLEDIQKEGTSLFSGNFCLRGLLPATIKELKGG